MSSRKTIFYDKIRFCCLVVTHKCVHIELIRCNSHIELLSTPVLFMKRNQILRIVFGVMLWIFCYIFWKYAIMDEVVTNLASLVCEVWCAICRE